MNFLKHFSFETDFNYFTKASYIKFIPGPLSSTGIAFSMLFTLKIPAIMDIHLKLASYSDYYYMIFFSWKNIIYPHTFFYHFQAGGVGWYFLDFGVFKEEVIPSLFKTSKWCVLTVGKNGLVSIE